MITRLFYHLLKSNSKKLNALRRFFTLTWLIVLLGIISVVWSIASWQTLAPVHTYLSHVSILSELIIFFEILFITGASMMCYSIGEKLSFKNPRFLISHIKYVKKEIKSIAAKSVFTKLFAFGFWLNFIGAIGTSATILFAVLQILPYQAWGIAVILFIDIALSLSWRVPVHMVRRKVIKGNI